MNTKLMEVIGQFVDANYLTAYNIEGYCGFAYVTTTLGEYHQYQKKWHFYMDQDGVVQREEVNESE